MQHLITLSHCCRYDTAAAAMYGFRGDTLEGSNVMYSSNGLHALQLQQDSGKLNVYRLDRTFSIDGAKSVLWSSWPHDIAPLRPHKGSYKLSLEGKEGKESGQEGDGKSFSIWDETGCIWTSQSWHNIEAPVNLSLHDDGNLVLYGHNGATAWTM